MKAEAVAASMVSLGASVMAWGVALAVVDDDWSWKGFALITVATILINFGVRLAIDCASGARWWSK